MVYAALLSHLIPFYWTKISFKPRIHHHEHHSSLRPQITYFRHKTRVQRATIRTARGFVFKLKMDCNLYFRNYLYKLPKFSMMRTLHLCLCYLLTPGLHKDIWYHVWPCLQITTCSVAYQPDDCRWPVNLPQALVWVNILTLPPPKVLHLRIENTYISWGNTVFSPLRWVLSPFVSPWLCLPYADPPVSSVFLRCPDKIDGTQSVRNSHICIQ